MQTVRSVQKCGLFEEARWRRIRPGQPKRAPARLTHTGGPGGGRAREATDGGGGGAAARDGAARREGRRVDPRPASVTSHGLDAEPAGQVLCATSRAELEDRGESYVRTSGHPRPATHHRLRRGGLPG